MTQCRVAAVATHACYNEDFVIKITNNVPAIWAGQLALQLNPRRLHRGGRRCGSRV